MRPRPLLAALLTLAVLLGMVSPAPAQPRPGTAEVKRVIGRVELLRKGQTQWLPVVVGARLAEGDDMRAFSGASAELELPDASTLLLAENSRILISKLDFDPQNQSRLALFHLAVGKVIATLSEVTLTLVRARQSNFTITTPTAVAAARGTRFEVAYNATEQQTRMVVLAKDPEDPIKKFGGALDCKAWFAKFAPAVRIGVDQYTEVKGTGECTPPAPINLLPPDELAAIGTLRLTFTPAAAEFDKIVTPFPPTEVMMLTGSGVEVPPFVTGASFADTTVQQLTQTTDRDHVASQIQASP